MRIFIINSRRVNWCFIVAVYCFRWCRVASVSLAKLEKNRSWCPTPGVQWPPNNWWGRGSSAVAFVRGSSRRSPLADLATAAAGGAIARGEGRICIPVGDKSRWACRGRPMARRPAGHCHECWTCAGGCGCGCGCGGYLSLSNTGTRHRLRPATLDAGCCTLHAATHAHQRPPRNMVSTLAPQPLMRLFMQFLNRPTIFNAPWHTSRYIYRFIITIESCAFTILSAFVYFARALSPS